MPGYLPIVATLHHSIHDPALRRHKGWLRAAYHRWWIAPNERRVLRRADRVVAVSNFVADMARQTLCDVPMQVNQVSLLSLADSHLPHGPTFLYLWEP